MGSYNVCSRLPMKKTRFQITPTGDDGSVKVLYNEVGKHLDVKESDFEMLYAGRLLKADSKISECSLQSQSTLYIVPTFSSSSIQQKEATPVSSVHQAEIFTALQSALLNPEYKNIVEMMVADLDTVENIIATTPGLDKDPSVLAMLLKPELLTMLARSNDLDSLLQKHPSLAQAIVTVVTAVNEEGAKSGAISNPASLSYSIDQMSDEEDDSPGPSRLQPSGSGGGGAAQSITASQLAAALQAATSSSSQARLQQHQQSAPAPSGSGTTIMNDFFQQAMRQAQNATSDAALQQLRNMGITDENVARQALAATNGDIQAAIDLIFGDGFM